MYYGSAEIGRMVYTRYNPSPLDLALRQQPPFLICKEVTAGFYTSTCIYVSVMQCNVYFPFAPIQY